MNQTYIYRKHLRKPLNYILLYGINIVILIALMTFGLIISEEKCVNLEMLVFLGIFMLINLFVLSLSLGLSYLLLLKRFQSISVTLTDDAIVYTNSRKQIIIPYGDIEKLQFPSVRYVGGWMKINYRGGSIRLTVALEQIGDFICKLKEKMDAQGLVQVYDEKKIHLFFKTAVFCDESWERIYLNFKILLADIYLSVIITTLILFFFSNGDYGRMIFMYGSLMAPILGFVVSEIIIGTQIKKRVNAETLHLLSRNREFELMIFRNLVHAFTVVYLLILFVVMIWIL